MEEYFSGVLDLYYALMTTDDTKTSKPTYGTPTMLAKSIEVRVTPTYKEGTVYASNTITRKEKRVDYYTVSYDADKIPYDVRKEILGRTQDANGVQHITGKESAPYLALLFEVTMDGGNSELWTLYKGKFSEVGVTAHTENEQINYQHPTIEGIFVRREYDNELAATAATDSEDLASTVYANWFTAVYEKP